MECSELMHANKGFSRALLPCGCNEVRAEASCFFRALASTHWRTQVSIEGPGGNFPYSVLPGAG